MFARWWWPLNLLKSSSPLTYKLVLYTHQTYHTYENERDYVLFHYKKHKKENMQYVKHTKHNLIFFLCGSRRAKKKGRKQWKSFYFVVFNGMYTHIHYLCMLNHLCRNVCGGKIRKRKERKKNRARNFRKGPKSREKLNFYSYRLISFFILREFLMFILQYFYFALKNKIHSFKWHIDLFFFFF